MKKVKVYNPEDIEVTIGGHKIDVKTFSWDLGDNWKIVKNRYTSFLLIFGIGKK